MDIYCPKCGEPVDMDYLHDVVDEGLHPDYKSALRAFQTKGCEAIGFGRCESDNTGMAPFADALYDLLGDDIDGAAAMLEDFGMGY